MKRLLITLAVTAALIAPATAHAVKSEEYVPAPQAPVVQRTVIERVIASCVQYSFFLYTHIATDDTRSRLKVDCTVSQVGEEEYEEAGNVRLTED